MKTSMSINKMMMTVMFLFACGLAMAGNNPSEYIIKTNIINDSTTELIEYLTAENGKLIPTRRCILVRENDQLTNKTTYLWTKKKGEWIKYIDVMITRNDRETAAEVRVWRNSGQIISHQKMVYLTNEKECIPQFVFNKDLETNNWILQNGLSLVSQR